MIRRSHYEKNKDGRSRHRSRRKTPLKKIKKSDVQLSTHGCNWAADNLSNLLQRRGIDASVVRKPWGCALKIMVGWYINNNSVQNHRQEMTAADKRVIWWVGTDILWLESGRQDIAWLNKNIHEHWAEWEHSAQRLRKCGLENVRVVHMPTGRRFHPLPLPEKFTAGVYCYDSRQSFYGIDLIRQAALLTPDIRWLLYPRYRASSRGNIEYHSRVENVEDIYRKMSVLVRVVSSDGMPQGPMEAMMCARPVLYNFQPLPHAIHMPGVTAPALASRLRELREEQRQGGGYNLEGAMYWSKMNDPEKLKREVLRLLNA